MADTSVTGNRERLKRLIEERAAELRLRLREVAERAGLSVSWIRHVRNDPNKDITPEVAAALDRALEWEPGSTAAILAGGEPTPKPTSSAVPLTPVGAGARGPGSGDVARAGRGFEMPESVLEMMERWQTKLSARDFAQLTLDLIRVRDDAFQDGWEAGYIEAGNTPQA